MLIGPARDKLSEISQSRMQQNRSRYEGGSLNVCDSFLKPSGRIALLFFALIVITFGRSRDGF